MPASAALVIGASSTIGQAFIHELLANVKVESAVAINREQCPETLQSLAQLSWLSCDNSPEQIAASKHKLAQQAPSRHYSQVRICQGILHDDNTWPEKRLEDINEATLHHIFQINTVIPALWLQQLLALLKGKQPCRIALLSARIGSISDNQLGGWYSYRASKAALNMLIQTASIEYARRAPNIKLLAFHPGTTDSPLSRPFQKSVPPDKLFTPEFVAKQLLMVINDCPIDGLAAYRDWNNQAINW
jgi:NAD(P)-dependent dehydrogenase (short-subunit alcohol dehydrogenase family)